MVSRLLLVAYFIEAGLVLVVTPWTRFWERNYFLGSSDVLHSFLLEPWVRGAVSGIGAITIVAGLLDLFALLSRRASREADRAQTRG